MVRKFVPFGMPLLLQLFQKADRIHWTDLTAPGIISEFVPTSSPVSPISLTASTAIYGCEDRLCSLDLITKKVLLQMTLL